MATLSQKQAKVNNMRTLDTEIIICPSYGPPMHSTKLWHKEYDGTWTSLPTSITVSWLWSHDENQDETVLKSNLKVELAHSLRDMHKLMYRSWMDVMNCGPCHGLRLELCWTSSATSETWNPRFWFIPVSVDSFVANWDQWHIATCMDVITMFSMKD